MNIQETNPFDARKEKFLSEFKTLENVSIGNKKAQSRAKKKKNYKKLKQIIDIQNEKRNEDAENLH